MAFDPFAGTMAEAMAQADPLAIARWGHAQLLTIGRARYEVNPLAGVALCAQHGLLMPQWLADAFLAGYRPSPQTKGAHAATERLRAQHGPWLERLFSPRNPRALPRTPAGRKEAARILGISEKQVRALLPKTRTHSAGHKPYTARQIAAGRAHNPFGLAAAEEPKF